MEQTMNKFEVKLGGHAHLGVFAPYGQSDIANLTGKDLAIAYVENPAHADGYLLSAYARGSRGIGGQVYALLYTRETVLKAIERFPEGTPSLVAHRGTIALGTCDMMSMAKTFGPAMESFPIKGLRALKYIVPDHSCKNAPYARAWEKHCAEAIDGIWVGGDQGCQYDIIVNSCDE